MYTKYCSVVFIFFKGQYGRTKNFVSLKVQETFPLLEFYSGQYDGHYRVDSSL